MATIVWDVDDVLNELTSRWLCSINHSSVLSKEQLTSPDFHTFLGWSEMEYLRSLDGFRLLSFPDLEPNRLIQSFMRDHDDTLHIVLTATPVISAHLSAEWTFRHFGKWIDGFLIAPSVRHDTYAPRSSKFDHISRLVSTHDRVICVDDRHSNFDAAQEAGATAILWPQPWNSSQLDCEKTLGQLSDLIN